MVVTTDLGPMQAGFGWGASIHMLLVFRDRSKFLASTRQLVADVCQEYLERCVSTSHVLMAFNELLENVVKYSSNSYSSVDFSLVVSNQTPTVRMRTQNLILPGHVAEVERLLERVVGTPDPSRYYDDMIETCGQRPGSGLGLIRIRAEAGFSLSFSVRELVLGVEATGPVLPKRN